MCWEWGIEIFATLVECVSAFYFIQDIEENRKQWRNILLALPLTATTIWINHYEMVSFAPVAFYLVYFMLFSWLLYKTDWLNRFWLSCVFLLLVLMCDYFTAVWIEMIAGLDGFVKSLEGIYFDARKYYLLIDKTVLVVVSILFKKYLQIFVVKTKYKFIITFGVLGIVLVYITYNFESVYAFMGWSIYVLVYLALTVIIVLYKKWKDAENSNFILQEKIQSYMNYYGELCEKQEEKARTIHDINYHLLTLSRLLEEREYQNCQQYVDKMIGDFEQEVIKSYTGNRTLDFMISFKKNVAEKQGIRVILDLDAVGREKSLEQADMNIIFGNLLDNAIEACCKMEEPERWIEIKLNKVMKMLFITIRNPYRTEPRLKGGTVVTSKKNLDMHGIGCQTAHCGR